MIGWLVRALEWLGDLLEGLEDQTSRRARPRRTRRRREAKERMNKRTWFKHRCWFCGHVSRDVEFIVGDSDYQCTDRQACQARYDAYTDDAKREERA